MDSRARLDRSVVLVVLAAIAAAGAWLVAARASSAASTSPTPLPVASHLRFMPSRFRAALTPKRGYGATVHYQLTENSVQTFVVKKQSGASWVTLKGTFVKRGREGKDVFPFPGVLHGHKLLTGHYMMVVTPAVPGVGTGKSVETKFTVTG